MKLKPNKISKSLRFHFEKFLKWLSVLFSQNRQLKKITFGYFRNWQFDNSYLLIDFQFENAIWFEVCGIKSVDFSKPIVLNLENIKTDKIDFTVYGFSEKQTYEITPNNVSRVATKEFKTTIKNISSIQIQEQQTLVSVPKFDFLSPKPQIKSQEISVTKTEIAIFHQPFKIQEHL